MKRTLHSLSNTGDYYAREQSVTGFYIQTQDVASITKPVRGIDMHSCVSTCLFFDNQTPSGVQSLSAPCHPPTDWRKLNDFHPSSVRL